MTSLQIIIYALVQGITELFPVSSVGHGVILPYLAGWTEISGNAQFLPLLVMLHLGTALALLVFFWRDWVDLISSLWMHKPRQRRLLGLIVVATIPAAIIGKVFNHTFTHLFPSAFSASIFLIVNGIVLFAADYLRRRAGDRTINQVGYGQSFLVGVVQVLALIPGFSRSGVTITAGLGLGLSYEESARFSFLLATPVILGAGVLEVPKMLKSHATHMLHLGLIGGLCAGIVALISTAFLMRYFENHDAKALRPFGIYCMVVGAVVAVMSLMHVHF